MSEKKIAFHTRRFKGGAYTSVISVIVIILVIFINLAAGQLNITFDLTTERKYTLTEETKELVRELNDPITIYYLCETGSELEEFKKIINQYPKASDKIKVEFKDIVKNPKFASQYTDEAVDYDSLIVVNEITGRSKYIDYSDLIVSELDYSTYQSVVTAIDVEGKIDAAIQYVTNEDLPTIYAVEGHGEESISEILGTILSNSNITYNTLNTITTEKIPEDCDTLFINQPQSDYSEEEISLIKNYLTNGGNAVICVDYITPELKNLSELLAYYGVQVTDGIILEGNSNYYRTNRMNELVPSIGSSVLTDGIRGKKYIISPVSSGLQILDKVRDTLSTTGFLTTSDDAYSKVDINSEVTRKESSDIEGPFYLGVHAVEEYNGVKTNVIVYSGKYLFNDSYISTSVFGNADLFLNTMNELAGQINTISVRQTSVEEELIVMTSAQKNRNGIIVIALIPLAILAIGIFVLIKRRKQ